MAEIYKDQFDVFLLLLLLFEISIWPTSMGCVFSNSLAANKLKSPKIFVSFSLSVPNKNLLFCEVGQQSRMIQ